MKRYRWVLFDADHTLFDFDKASEEALAEVLADEGAASFGYHTCWFNPNEELCDLRQSPDYTINHLTALKEILVTEIPQGD